MRDLLNEELDQVYGAGGRGKVTRKKAKKRKARRGSDSGPSRSAASKPSRGGSSS